MVKFQIGERVIRNPESWEANPFDSWGRGIGVGVVVQAPFQVDDLNLVDVRWPAGRCFEPEDGLLPAPPEGSDKPPHPLPPMDHSPNPTDPPLRVQ
jgi:hypothetical protein